MRTPLVSVCMPVYNGERFLAQAIESLLNQDHRNIELIILDNQSTDDTPLVCRKFADADARVRYILDNEFVDVMEGHKRAAGHARGEYVLVACDDDVYEPTYLTTLMALLEQHPEVGLAYSGYDWVDEHGARSAPALPPRYLRNPSNSRLGNFAFYLLHRCPVPLAFGLLRRDVHLDALRYYYRVDHRGWNHDNLYMLRLMSCAGLASTSEVLFHYRKRDRSGQKPTDLPTGPVRLFFYQAVHQVRVSRAIDAIVSQSSFGLPQRLVLRSYNVVVLAYELLLRRLYSKVTSPWRSLWPDTAA